MLIQDKFFSGVFEGETLRTLNLMERSRLTSWAAGWVQPEPLLWHWGWGWGSESTRMGRRLRDSYRMKGLYSLTLSKAWGRERLKSVTLQSRGVHPCNACCWTAPRGQKRERQETHLGNTMSLWAGWSCCITADVLMTGHRGREWGKCSKILKTGQSEPRECGSSLF